MITPAQPPFPIAENFWFHFSNGSQVSKTTSDVLVGLMTPVTRQKSGSPVMGARAPGGVNEPPVTIVAALIVTLESRTLDSASQRAAALTGRVPGVAPIAAAKTTAIVA
jgi:hypothetical protein